MVFVARERLEPATPAFSELVFPVFPTTSTVALGLPNTGKYEESAITVGDSGADNFHLDLRKTRFRKGRRREGAGIRLTSLAS